MVSGSWLVVSGSWFVVSGWLVVLAAKNAKGAKVGGGIQISFALIFLKTLRLKSRGPPKKRISDGVIEMPLTRRNSMRWMEEKSSRRESAS